MGLALDSRIKNPNVGILVLVIEFEVRTTEYNSLVECCYENKVDQIYMQ